MTQLDSIIAQLTKIAKMDDIAMRTELGFYVRELERQFEKAERDLEAEFDNFPV